MYFRTLSFLLGFLLTTSLAFAEDHGAPAEGGHDAKPAEGGGHGEAAAEPKKIKTSEESYMVVQARVSGLEAKVHAGENEIQKLIAAKQQTKDPEKLNEIIKQIIHQHHELEKTIKEYDQQRSLLKYRYPEKGQAEKREYERIELKSIEEMEGQLSLTSTVKRTLKKVRSQYGSEEKKPESESHGKKAPKKAEPSLVDPVILSK